MIYTLLAVIAFVIYYFNLRNKIKKTQAHPPPGENPSTQEVKAYLDAMNAKNQLHKMRKIGIIMAFGVVCGTLIAAKMEGQLGNGGNIFIPLGFFFGTVVGAVIGLIVYNLWIKKRIEN